MDKAPDRREREISGPRLAVFASPAFVAAALLLSFGAILKPMFAREPALGLTAVGVIFMVRGLFDVFTDPLFGAIADGIRPRFGRRRLPMALAVPILAYGVYRVYLPGEPLAQGELLVMLLVVTIGWTMLSISHNAWASELSSDYHYRSIIMSTLQAWGIVGYLAVLLVPVLVDARSPVPNMRLRAEGIGWLILLTLPILSAVALYAVPERARRARCGVSWRAGLRSITENRALWRLLLVDLLWSLAMGVNGALHYFFVESVLGMLRAAPLLQVAQFVTGLCCVPLFLRLSYRVGKHRALCWGAVFSSFATALMFFIPAGSWWIALGVFVLTGVPISAKWFLMYSMMADVIDRDTVNVGAERNALHYSMLTLTTKFGGATLAPLIYPVLASVGFDPKGVNDVATLDTLRLLVAGTPSLVTLAVAAIMWRYPIDEAAQQRTRSELRRLRLDGRQPNGSA